MALPIEPILGILADNLALRGSVLPIGARRATAWAGGLDLPQGGRTVLYTGLMYQLMPAIRSLGRMMAQMEEEGSWKLSWMGLGRKINRWVNTAPLMARADAAEERVFDRRLAHIASLLQRAGVSFGYLYEKELYAGALLYDQGVDDVLETHARRVFKMLRENGVKALITVDPHTTHLLRRIYPQILSGYDIEVRSYLEVLAETGIEPASRREEQELVLHDSCVYARAEGVIHQPRLLLDRAGIHQRPIDAAGKFTHCCGGPIESLFPKRARAVAQARIDQLKASGCDQVAAMCPICLVNLDHAAKGNDIQVADLSEYLHEAYCGL